MMFLSIQVQGMYGLKPDAIDITKFVTELPLHDLLSGNYSSPCISKDKGKKSASSNNDLMHSVRKACSVLQTRRGLQIQNSAEMDNSCNRSDSTTLVTVNSAVGQTDLDKEDNRTELLSSGEVQESYEKIRKSSIADSPLYTPYDVFERLALPLPKNLDLLLSDASKTTTKICADPRIGKSAPHRTGLPPFPWSHSFSGNTKLGSGAVKVSASRTSAVKVSASRTTCQGRWVKVKNPIALQKGSVNLLADFESVVFNKSLVPSDNLLLGKQENIFTPTERALSVSGACSTSKVAADECSSIHVAAQTLIDMGAYSKENPYAVVKLLKKPSQITMKATKSKAIKRCDFVDVPNSKIRPTNSLKASDGFPSKKLRLSKDACSHTEVPRQGKSHLPEIRSPLRKVFITNLVKKSSVLKTPRSIDRSSSSKPKFWKPSQ